MMRVSLMCLVVLAAVRCDLSCNMGLDERVDCGYVGINQWQCEQKGCCWVPTSPAPFLRTPLKANYPWCFFKSDSNVCKNFNWKSNGMGFTQEWFEGMNAKYNSQLDVQNCGAVVAAPDHNTPGGDYYFAWMRDGALSMRTYMEINDDYNTVRQKMESYTNWVTMLQGKQDNNVDVRIEPKFNIPSGDPYTGGWCRPQTDGPALRAYAMIKWANMLIENGQENYVREHLWNHNGSRGGVINYDLAWLVDNWRQDSCDLWEEIRTSDIFWNVMSFRYTLYHAADFARKMGDNDSASRFDQERQGVEQKIDGHWNGEYLQEAGNRPVDSAVIHALVSFPGYFAFNDDKVVKTIQHNNGVFCREYKINQDLTKNGQPGLYYGRYPGDHYAGGNPWVLLTSVNAEIYYKAAADVLKRGYVEDQDVSAWGQLVDVHQGMSASAMAATLLSAGDSILDKVYQSVKNDDFRLDEQLDRDAGYQKSAKSLTWSYANVLRALKIRDSINNMLLALY